MRRSWLLSLVFVTGVAVCDASAQTAAPLVELGVDVSGTIARGVQQGPRLVVNFDGRNAVQLTVSFQKLSPWDDLAERKTDDYLATYRRLVHADGPVRVSATLGGGLERTVIFVPAITFGNPPVTFPASRGVHVRPLFTTGAAVDLRLWSRAAIVLESSFVLTGRLDGRFSAGLVVPMRSYPARDRLATSVPWAELDAGDRAWVTTGDGREIDGEVVGRSAATLTLRTPTGTMSLTADDVRAIDTTDPIRNGIKLGSIIGSLAAILPSIGAAALVCLDQPRAECGVGERLSVGALLMGTGAGVGAAAGALADSLRERRVPLYRRGGSTRVAMVPIVGVRRLGGGAVIRW